MQIMVAKLNNRFPIITHQLEDNRADLHSKTEPRQKCVLSTSLNSIHNKCNFSHATFSSATEYLALNNVMCGRIS